MARIIPLKASLVLAAMALAVLGGAFVVRRPLLKSLFLFLSMNRPVKAEVLVVEGWLQDRALKEAATEFVRGKYSLCLVSGKTRSHCPPACVLTRAGFDTGAVRFVEAEMRKGHKTYHRALAARQWLKDNRPEVRTLNVFTAGPHGRKSLAIFRRVFGRGFSIGVVCSSVAPDDPRLGWESIRGARNMVKYLIGYFYGLVWPFNI